MRDDLSDARAAVNWSVAQMDVLKSRLVAWRQNPPYRLVSDHDAETGEKLLRLRDVQLPPAIINAEVGFIVHAIRSALDVLINTLAERNGHIAPKDARFPICRDIFDFRAGKHAGRKAIKRLSPADQTTIEDLEPWYGGKNPMLIALHDLDIMRKHRRLIAVTMEPYNLFVQGAQRGRPMRFLPISAAFQNDAVVARLTPEFYDSYVELAFDITFNEAGIIANRPVLAALNDFADLASSIIGLFDM